MPLSDEFNVYRHQDIGKVNAQIPNFQIFDEKNKNRTGGLPHWAVTPEPGRTAFA
jgi:hypothetical protein